MKEQEYRFNRVERTGEMAGTDIKHVHRGRYNMDFNAKTGNPYGILEKVQNHINRIKPQEPSGQIGRVDAKTGWK